MSGSSARVAVVGAGAAGLAAALELGRAGVSVDLYSLLPASCSPSACERDGLGAAEAGDEAAIERHFLDTLEAGGQLAHQPPLRAMIEAAPSIVDELLRLGVPFDRDAQGALVRDALGGATEARAVHAGVHTGRQLVRVLDAQLLRFEEQAARDARSEPLLRRFEHWEFLRLVLDDAGRAVGLVARERSSARHVARPYAAVLLATGGAFAHFARSTASLVSHGSAAAAVFRQGAIFVHADLVEEHPTTVLVRGRRRVVAELLQSRGARLWVPRDPSDTRAPETVPAAERRYLREGATAQAGDLAGRAELVRALRAAFDPAAPQGGSADEDRAFLDLGGVAPALLEAELGELLPAHRQLRVGPAVSGAMGGLWVDYEADERGQLVEGSPRNQATNIAGLYAAGEVGFQLHGAARLGENALLGCLYEGKAAARAIVAYTRSLAPPPDALDASFFERRAREADEELASQGDGARAAFELCEAVRRCAQRALEADGEPALLAACAEQLDELDARAREPAASDAATEPGPAASKLHELRAMSLHARLFVRARHARLAAATAGGAASPGAELLLARASQSGDVELVDAFEHVAMGSTRRVDRSVDRRYTQAGAAREGAAPEAPPVERDR